MVTRRLTDAEILAQMAAAKRRTEERLRSEPVITAARYSGGTRQIVLELSNGTVLRIPAATVPGLEAASASARADMVITSDGFDLRWERLDLDLGLAQLVVLALGHPLVARAGATVAGSRTSPAKAAAARRNGRKGGRPAGR